MCWGLAFLDFCYASKPWWGNQRPRITLNAIVGTSLLTSSKLSNMYMLNCSSKNWAVKWIQSLFSHQCKEDLVICQNDSVVFGVKQMPKNGFQRPAIMGTTIICTTLLMPNTLPCPIIIYYVHVDLKTLSSEIEFNHYFLAIDMKI